MLSLRNWLGTGVVIPLAVVFRDQTGESAQVVPETLRARRPSTDFISPVLGRHASDALLIANTGLIA